MPGGSMRQYKLIVLIAFIGMLPLLAFQNCATSDSGGTTGAPVDINTLSFSDIETSKAQAVLSSYENVCASNQAASTGYPLIAAGGTITNGGDFQSSDVLEIQGSGNVTVYGTIDGSSVENITNFNGNVMLCGLDLEMVSGANTGILLIDSGEVNIISGFKGSILIINGDFPAGLAHFHGNIYVKTLDGHYLGRVYDVE